MRGAAAVAACLLLAPLACGGAAGEDGAPAVPASDSAAAGSSGQAAAFDVSVDPAALPTNPLDRDALVDDACSFATAEQVAAFFAFHDGPATAETGNGIYAGTDCAYALQDPEVFMEVQFGQSRTSSTEEIELAGMEGVLRNVSGSTLENRARVQIPFRIEGSPVDVAVIQFHVRGVPPADEEALRVAIDALGANLIERLGLAGDGQ
jgi:hypothetical protein